MALFIAVPLVRDLPPPAPADDDPHQDLREERQRLLADLYDLEQAFHSGRLSRRDYDRLRGDVGADLSLVLDELERADVVDSETVTAEAPA